MSDIIKLKCEINPDVLNIITQSDTKEIFTLIKEIFNSSYNESNVKRGLHLLREKLTNQLVDEKTINTYEIIENGFDKLENIRKYYLEAKEKLSINTKFFFNEFNSKDHDYLKICIDTKNANIDEYNLCSILEKDYNIYAEFAMNGICLIYLGLNTTKKDSIQ